MAIASVLTMVHQRLPFTSDASNDATIDSIRIQMCYLMQSQTLKDNASVELEASYSPLENMLFAAMTCYQMVLNKTMLNIAGNGTTGSTGGAKILTKAKADVTEAEFTISKAIDGALLQMPTSEYLAALLAEICAMGRNLNYNVIWCNCPLDIIPAFIVTCDYPPSINHHRDIYDGNPIP